jgi:hypothetical protein
MNDGSGLGESPGRRSPTERGAGFHRWWIDGRQVPAGGVARAGFGCPQAPAAWWPRPRRTRALGRTRRPETPRQTRMAAPRRRRRPRPTATQPRREARGGSRGSAHPRADERPEVDLDAQPGEVERVDYRPAPGRRAPALARRSRPRPGRLGFRFGDRVANDTATTEAKPGRRRRASRRTADPGDARGNAEGTMDGTTGTRPGPADGARAADEAGARPSRRARPRRPRTRTGRSRPQATRSTAAKTTTRKKTEQPKKAKAEPKTTEGASVPRRRVCAASGRAGRRYVAGASRCRSCRGSPTS